MAALTRWLLLGACIVASCNGSNGAVEPTAATPRAARADPVERAIAAAAIERQRAPSSCQNSCCKSLEGAATQWEGDGARGSAHGPEVRAALQRIITTTSEPTHRALAIEWLGESSQVEDVSVIEQYLSSRGPAWPAPRIMYTQAVMDCYEIAGWTTATVDEVALAALGRLIGRHFDDVQAFRSWRKLNPDLLGSLAHWHRQAWGADVAVCRRLVADLGARDLDLLLRLSAQRNVSDPKQPQADCPSIADVATIMRERHGTTRLLGYLRDPGSWSPDRDDGFKRTDWRSLSIWALDHATSLFDGSHVDALAALLDQPAVQAEAAVAGRVAVAVADLAPERSDAALKRVVTMVPRPPYSFALAYARRYPQDPRIWDWLQSHDQDHYALLSRGAVSGLGEAGTDGLRVLQRLVHDADFETANGWVLGAVIDVAERRGKKLTCEGDLSYVCHKVDRKTCAERTKRSAVNRRQCLASMRAWLADELR